MASELEVLSFFTLSYKPSCSALKVTVQWSKQSYIVSKKAEITKTSPPSSMSLKITNRISEKAKREMFCLQSFSSFSDSEGAGGGTHSFTHWPLVLRHLLPPITPSLCLSLSPRVQLWTRRIVLFDDLTSLSVTWMQTQRHAHIVTHTQRCPAVTVWHPDRFSFKGYVSIWCDNHDKDF